MTTASHPDNPPATGIKRHIPNLLVILRLVMTAVMIGVLSIYRFPDTNAWALPLATALFIIAALTDALDGYLARKWNAVSVFGRIMDPTADKILVLGAFVMLAGPGFNVPGATIPLDNPVDLGASSDLALTQISGVYAWMVIVILSRELLVTAMRGALESHGVDFSASISGKLKMMLQSIGAPLIMVIVYMAGLRVYEGDHQTGWAFIPPEFAAITNAGIASMITLITALSAIPYITRARTAFKSSA